MTRNPNPAQAADRLAARRARAERSVRAVGYWTPELLGAGVAAAGALLVWPGAWPLWVMAGLLLARIPARPLLARWRTHRATAHTSDPRLLTHHHDDNRRNDQSGTDWEATA